MSAPTVSSCPTAERTVRIRSARVQFCDRGDADIFLEWIRARSTAVSGGATLRDITFPVFVCTAADAYSVSSALTCAVFGDSDIDDLPQHVATLVQGSELPAVFGPFHTGAGWEVIHVLSVR